MASQRRVNSRTPKLEHKLKFKSKFKANSKAKSKAKRLASFIDRDAPKHLKLLNKISRTALPVTLLNVFPPLADNF